MPRRALGRAFGPTVVSILAALALAGPVSARVSAEGSLSGSGTVWHLAVRNTGDDVVRCLRFVAVPGVEIVDVVGPGRTTILPPVGFRAQGFELAPGGRGRWTFSTRDPYPAGAGGRLFVSSTCQIDIVAPVSGPAGVAAAPPAGRRHVVRRLSGTVRVRRRGARRFTRLGAERTISDGSEIDARHGRARITVADGAGGEHSAEVGGGRVVVDQEQAARPLTRLRLSEPLPCPRTGADGSATRRRTLTVRAAGAGFRTVGRFATAAAGAGAAWRTTDTCTRTVVDALRGTATVTSRSGRRVTAREGQRVVARAPGA